jgi:hypothetical protein
MRMMMMVMTTNLIMPPLDERVLDIGHAVVGVQRAGEVPGRRPGVLGRQTDLRRCVCVCACVCVREWVGIVVGCE